MTEVIRDSVDESIGLPSYEEYTKRYSENIGKGLTGKQKSIVFDLWLENQSAKASLALSERTDKKRREIARENAEREREMTESDRTLREIQTVIDNKKRELIEVATGQNYDDLIQEGLKRSQN